MLMTRALWGKWLLSLTTAHLGVGCYVLAALADKPYGPGVTDTEIRIGQTMAYSGPASAYGTIGAAEAGYFAKVNAEGGVNGRRIRLISLDDGYSPPKTVEQTRRLVEQEKVLLMFSSLGTGPNAAVHKYLNANRVPQLFIASTGMQWHDPQNYPWTMALAPNQRTNIADQVGYLVKQHATARIAVLYENTDYGREYLQALKDLLGGAAGRMIVAAVSYETSDATVDSQIITLKNSGADTFFNFSTARFASQAIRKIHDLGWKPLHFLPSSVASIATVLKPAGLDKSVGLISDAYWKNPTDPRWAGDPAVQAYLTWMAAYFPKGDVEEIQNVFGYSAAQLLVRVLQQCGEDLVRENVMRQATSLQDLELPMLLPGIRINTSATDYLPVEQTRMVRFDGKRWVPFDE
jgi:ABC-type branched-subunit amino acid transport system substrate-binding protein